MRAFSLLLAFVLQDKLPANGTEPCWSRDGTKIAFGVSEGNQRSLRTMNADGTNVRTLVPAGDTQHYLCWFPDGSRLSYVTAAGKGYEFVSIKPDGSDKKPLLPDKAPKPGLVPVRWSPDGTRVAYSAQLTPEARPKVVIVDVKTGDLVDQVAGSEYSGGGEFSPDGKHFLYLSKDKLWVGDGRGQGAKAIVEGARPSYPSDPTWSPDGSTILYVWNDRDLCELRTIRPDGSGAERFYGSPVRVFYPSWSPSGDRVLLAVRQTEDWDLRICTIDGKSKSLSRIAGEDEGAPIFDLLGKYAMEGKDLTGSSVWSRAVGGGVVRERWEIRTGRRPYDGELSLTRCAPNSYEAVQLHEWNGEQQYFTGVWDAAKRTLTFDRVLPEAFGKTAKPSPLRWIYRFDPDGSFRKETLVADAKGELVRQSECRYVKAR